MMSRGDSGHAWRDDARMYNDETRLRDYDALVIWQLLDALIESTNTQMPAISVSSENTRPAMFSPATVLRFLSSFVVVPPLLFAARVLPPVPPLPPLALPPLPDELPLLFDPLPDFFE